MLNCVRFNFTIILTLLFQVLAAYAEYQPNIENGAKYYQLAGCAACHGASDNTSLVAGGEAIETGLGKFYVPNISSSKEHGIGEWQVSEFVKAIKNGKQRDGSSYIPIVFPYTSYASMLDSDVKDIFHFIKSLAPVDQDVEDHDVSVLTPLKTKVWSTESIWETDNDLKTDNFGEYYVKAVGHCIECHTQRSSLSKQITINPSSDLWKHPKQRLGKTFSNNGLVYESLDEYFESASVREYVDFLASYTLSSTKKVIDPLKKSLINSMRELSGEEHVSVYEYLSQRETNRSEKQEFARLSEGSVSSITQTTSVSLAASNDNEAELSECNIPPSILNNSNSAKILKFDQIDFNSLDEVDQIFGRACNACHAGSGNNYGFAMTSSAEMYNDFPTALSIFESIRSGSMPKGEKLTAEEYALIKAWMQSARSASKSSSQVVSSNVVIKAEQQTEEQKGSKSNELRVITLPETYKLLADDLINVDEFDREFIRYVDFSKSKFPKFECDEAGKNVDAGRYIEAGFNKLINSLSLNPRLTKVVKLPTSSGPIFRIDLRDYNWSQDQWRAIFQGEYNSAAERTKYNPEVWSEVNYPYAVDPASAPNLGLIASYTETVVPIVNGPWLSNKALESPIYDMLLGLTDRIDDLEDRLNLDVKKEIMDGNVARAAMIGTSGVSDHNRLIERFDLPMGGYYWKSYDFDGSGGDKSLELNPDGPYPEVSEFGFQTFEHAGGEMIFSLPNALQGFYLSEADGRRLQVGPASIVAFKEYIAGKGVEIENARSCFECHDNGIIQKSDNLRPVVENSNFFTREQKRRLQRMFVAREDLYAYFENDRMLYTNALKRIDATQTAVSGELESLRVPAYQKGDGWPLRDRRELVTFLADKYFQDFYAEDIAQLFGMSESEFFDEASNVNDPIVFRLIKNWEQRAFDGRRIHRHEVEENYGKILSEITDLDPERKQWAAVEQAAIDMNINENSDQLQEKKLLLQVMVDGGSERRVNNYLEFAVETNFACNLQLFYVSEAKQILELSADARVLGPNILEPGERRSIPYEKTVQLQFDTPGKGETMLAYCSKDEPLRLNDILAYVEAFSQPLTRGLKIVASSSVVASKGTSDFDSVTFNVK